MDRAEPFSEILAQGCCESVSICMDIAHGKIYNPGFVLHRKLTAVFFRDMIDAYCKNHTRLNYTVWENPEHLK
jgi:hypothetical protein